MLKFHQLDRFTLKMEPEQIRFELFKATERQLERRQSWQSLRHLKLKLKKEDSEKLLNVLLEIFFTDPRYAYQKIAGGFLWKLKPQYRRNLREDIKHSLQNWNISVEELPWYFAEATDINRTRSEVEWLLTEPPDDISQYKAKKYLWWLLASNLNKFRAELNQKWNERLGD